MVLNHNTSPSGHNKRCQNIESIIMVDIKLIKPAGTAYFSSLEIINKWIWFTLLFKRYQLKTNKLREKE